MNAPWGPLPLDSGTTVGRELGDLRLEVAREGSDVWVGARHEGAAGTSPERRVRWSLAATDTLELRPTLPDRPLVVSPESPFHLPPKGRAHIFVRVPVTVRLVCVDDRGNATTLEEFPSIVLSDTWWGSFTEGELAYWVPTRARTSITDDIFEPHFAVCSFRLTNVAEEALPVERFAVRVAYLTIFGSGKAIWTDEVLVRYEGPQEGSDIRYTGRVPEDAGSVRKIADPREPAPRGLQARTFGRLRSLSGMG